MSGLLYKLDFPSGKSYIGITRQPLADRLKGHRYDALRGRSFALHQAWRKYGEPIAQVLAVVEECELLATEVRAIRAFGTLRPGGYNLTPGGEFAPALLPEVAAKISAAAKGRIHSPEVVAKRAASLRRTYSQRPELRALTAARFKGRVVSAETRAKQGAAMRGRVLSAEHRAKLVVARNQRPPMSAETRAKMSAAHKGRTFSPETRAKLSLARRLRRLV